MLLAPKRSKIPALTAGVVFGLVAAGVGAFGDYSLQTRIGVTLFGIWFTLVVTYFGICRLEFDGQTFTARPGKKKYLIGDIVSWKLHEDFDEAPGCKRYLELRFDRWYRRYILHEDDVSTSRFNQLVRSLHDRKGT